MALTTFRSPASDIPGNSSLSFSLDTALPSSFKNSSMATLIEDLLLLSLLRVYENKKNLQHNNTLKPLVRSTCL